jgi:hypothetical protein
MAPEDVIIVPVLGTPEKMAIAQDVEEVENVHIVEVQEDWLQEYGHGLLNDLKILIIYVHAPSNTSVYVHRPVRAV